MRRFFLAATMLTIVAGGPLQARAGDREIAEQIIQKLKVQRDAGTLKDFTLDLKVDKGVVLMRGNVRESAQKQSVLSVTKGIEGIANVVDEITIAPIAVPTAKPAEAPTAKPAAVAAKPATVAPERATVTAKPAPATAEQATVTAVPASVVARPATVTAKPAEQATATVVRPKAAITTAQAEKKPASSTEPNKPTNDSLSFKQALAAAVAKQPVAKEAKPVAPVAQVAPVAPVAQANKPSAWQPASQVAMAAATDVDASATVESDRTITSAVVNSLGAAQRQGRLKGFGVDVNTQQGRVYVSGRASSEEHRELITNLVRKTPGVIDVVDEIAVYGGEGSIPQPVVDNGSGEPTPLSDYAPNLTPVAVDAVERPGRSGTSAIATSARPIGVPVQTAPYHMQNGQPMQAMPAGMGMHGGGMGSPMPMAPYAGGAAAPRYEQPYLPNYAWPGYAAYPNYAAVTYPQQYSPSAFPYIGPFYPYPQVPLGWRKVSLEWDDGWWFLDFTDR